MTDHLKQKPVEGTVRLAIVEARALAVKSLQKLHYAPADASIIADHVIDAELCGYGYSGLAKILNVAADSLNALPRKPVTIAKEGPFSALVDGGNNVGMLAMYKATEIGIEKAKQHGFSIVGVFDSYVSGRIGYYLEMAAKADLVGIHFVSARPKVAPPGGMSPRLGTNPFSLGVPSLRGPVIFDMGTAAISGSDLMLKARLNQVLPEGLAINASGNPTTDPHEALRGSILNFGGYKGFGLSFCIQAFGLLAGVSSSDKKHYGFLQILFDPGLITSVSAYKEEVTRLVDYVKGTPCQPGVQEIRIPSERAFSERAQRLMEGSIDVEQRVYDELMTLVSSASHDV